jgi:hypothetical protein
MSAKRRGRLVPCKSPQPTFDNAPYFGKMPISRDFIRVSEGTRTPDRLDHNQELYQLSYAHRGANESTIAMQ